MFRLRSRSYRRFTLLLLAILPSVIAVPVLAQTTNATDDGTVLKQIIIFGRHSIRSSTSDPSSLDQFAADPYPAFTGVPTGYLTPRGQQAERLLGSYFHDYLLHEGLLTGNPQTDLARSYFRANSIQRSFITATNFGAGLIPGATIPVHSYPIAGTSTPAVPDPVFDPLLAGVATVDPDRAVAEAQGMFNSGAALALAYSGELSLIHDVLYPLGTQPTPGAQGSPGSVDPTSQTSSPFTLASSAALPPPLPPYYTGNVIDMGGLHLIAGYATDPFIMQYADDFPLNDVAWGRLSTTNLSQQTRLIALWINIAMRTPYLNQVQSSNAGSHLLRSMMQAVSGANLSGAFGNAKSRFLVIISSDAYVAGLAGLLQVHWLLPGYQPDFIGPGGALVFELRQVRTTKQYLVRVFFTGQTLDQLRNLTPLILDAPPATMQLAVPGGSLSTTNLDVKFTTFKKLLKAAIDQQSVQPYGKEVPPGVLDNVPLD
jgi:4-phytase/acid phosphatase